jgi:hypothetical protein
MFANRLANESETGNNRQQTKRSRQSGPDRAKVAKVGGWAKTHPLLEGQSNDIS